jgi:Homeodomain-like domain-containing protein
MDLESSGETHLAGRKKAMPDSLINEIALLMVESCGDSGTPPPQTLSILLRAQFNRIADPSFVSKDGRTRDLAILLYASDRTLSTREVARAVGVHHTTVSRWKQETNFQNKIDTSGKISNARRLVDKLIKRTR